MAKDIAVFSVGPWGRKIARNIAMDKRFRIVSLMANFPDEDEIWRYAENKAPISGHNGITKELIREKLVEHGLVPTMKEWEGEEEEPPDAHKKTVDIAITDMGAEINEDVVTALENHVRMRIFAHAGNSDEKKKLERLGATSVCPDIDGYGADLMVPLLTETHIKLMGSELGEWDGAVMPVPSSWTGKSVKEVEEQYNIGVVLVRAKVIIEKKGKREEIRKETFRPNAEHVFREEDSDMKVIARDHSTLLRVEAEIDK